MKTFRRDGIRFEYPLNWTLSTEDDGTAWTATLESQQTAFLVVSLRTDLDDANELAELTLKTLTVDYKDLESVEVIDTVAGQPAVGQEMDLLTVDSTVLIFSRCLNAPTGALLILGQVSDYDREFNEPVLRMMLASVTIDEDDD